MSKKETQETESSSENFVVRLQRAKIYQSNFNIIIESPDKWPRSSNGSASSYSAAKPWEDKGRLLMSFEECGENFFAPIAVWFLPSS